MSSALEAEAHAPESWPLPKLTGFRFALLYWIFGFATFPLYFFPWFGEDAAYADQELRNRGAAWIGETVLGLNDLSTTFTGSGDGVVAWIFTATLLAAAAVGAAAWSLAIRRAAHPRLAYWFVELLSISLGVYLVSYGIAKAIPNQMPFPRLTRLLLPYGEASPMGVVWRFMGTSPAYSMAAGWAELIPGLLLFFRPTRTAGALLGSFVMANVVLLNFCFDVPVKLFSVHLFVGLVALLLLDRRRLLGALFSRRAMPSAVDATPASPRAQRRWLIARVSFLAMAVTVLLARGFDRYFEYGNGRPKPPLWGIHNVTEFKRDGAVVPPLTTDETRWSALVVDNPMPREYRGKTYPGGVTVVHMDGSQEHVPVDLDVDQHTLTLLSKPAPAERREQGDEQPEPVPRGVLHFERPAANQLVLTGTLDGAAVEIELTERNLEETMLLIGRGFHWVNDYPFNR